MAKRKKILRTRLTGSCSKAMVSFAYSVCMYCSCFADTSSICELAVKTRYAHPAAMFLPWHCPPLPIPSASKHPPMPSGLPRVCESEMMARVRAARSKILDPVLERNIEFLASLPPDIDEESTKGTEKPKGRTNNGKHKSHAHGANRRKKHVGSNTTIRPRGPGGVFVKRSTLVEGKSTPEFATPTTPASATSELARCMSSVSSIGGGEGRPKRQRRPSVRVLEGIPSLGSRRSSRRQSSALSTPAGSASPAPEVAQQSQVRLIIRLPPRSALARDNTRDSTTSCASTSSSVSASLNTPSGSTDVTPVTQSFRQLAEQDDDMDVDEVKEEEVDHYDWNGLDNVSTSDEDVSAGEDEKTEPEPLSSTSKSVNLAVNGKNGKVRSKTFNQTWSVSEQHLLDRLLEQFPDGTKNR